MVQHLRRTDSLTTDGMFMIHRGERCVELGGTEGPGRKGSPRKGHRSGKLGKVTEMSTLKGQKEMFEERHQIGIQEE